MRRILRFVAVTLLALSVSDLNAQETGKPIFELVDGYYQNKGHWPVHLTHEIEKQNVWLGDSVNMYISIGLVDGVDNPCDQRSETPCRFGIFLEITENGQPKVFSGGVKEFRITEVIGITTSVLISRKAPLGPADISFIVNKGGKELYVLRIPVEVK